MVHHSWPLQCKAVESFSRYGELRTPRLSHLQLYTEVRVTRDVTKFHSTGSKPSPCHEGSHGFFFLKSRIFQLK